MQKDKDLEENLIKERSQGPELSVGEFVGPLDLVLYLIEKNEIDLFDLPIAELTNQYLEYLEDPQAINLDNISDFIVTGAKLVHIKSKMILPQEEEETEEDPRDELVWRLLIYRRCKHIAAELEERASQFAGVYFNESIDIEDLGLEPYKAKDFYADASEFSANKFDLARENLAKRNESRYKDLNERINYIVQRKHLSIIDEITHLNMLLERYDEVNFNKVHSKASSKAEIVTGFLAVLELLDKNKIIVQQSKPFADIILRKKQDEDDQEND